MIPNAILFDGRDEKEHSELSQASVPPIPHLSSSVNHGFNSECVNTYHSLAMDRKFLAL